MLRGKLQRPRPGHDRMVIPMACHSLLRRLIAPTYVLGVAVLVFGCGDDKNGDGATKTPATCMGVCVQQKELCQSNVNCEADCSTLEGIVADCDCEVKVQRLFDCKAKLNVCDADGSLCSPKEWNDCAGVLCRPLTCHEVCLRQNTLCGTQSDCMAVCDAVESRAVVSNCDRSFEEGLRCLREKDVCDQDETACPATAFDACVQAFCETRPTSSACTG
jgi:hypothetical protein